MAFLSLLPIMACNEAVDSGNSDGQSNELSHRAIIKVVDASNLEALPDLKISIIGGESGETNEYGLFKAENLKSGNQIIRIEKKDYASIEMNLAIVQTNALRPVNMQVTANYPLYKKGSKLQGRLLYSDAKGNVSPLAKGEIELVLGEEFVKRLYLTTTDDAGKFEISDLPEGQIIYLNLKEKILGGLRYGGLITGNPVLLSAAGELKQLGSIPLNPISSQQNSFTIPNQLVVAEGKALEVSFPFVVDTSAVDRNNIVLQYASGSTTYIDIGSAITAEIDWADGATILKVKPLGSTWKTKGNYTLLLNGITGFAGDLLLNSSIGIKVNGSNSAESDILGKVEGLRVMSSIRIDRSGSLHDTDIVDNGSPFKLIWRQAKNAAGYQILLQDTIGHWKILTNANVDTVFNYSPQANSIQKMSYSFRIVPYNNNGKTYSDKAGEIKITDKVSPILDTEYSTGNADNIFGFNNAANSQASTVKITWGLNLMNRPNFSGGELLDTLVTPKIKVLNSTTVGDPEYMATVSSQRWISFSSFQVTLSVAELKDARGDTLEVDLSGIKDLSGNELKATNGAPPKLRFIMPSY